MSDERAEYNNGAMASELTQVAKSARAIACTKDINRALSKHQCTLKAKVTIEEDRTISIISIEALD